MEIKNITSKVKSMSLETWGFIKKPSVKKAFAAGAIIGGGTWVALAAPEVASALLYGVLMLVLFLMINGLVITLKERNNSWPKEAESPTTA